jgi:small subunit ribosomal protein S20
LPSGPRLADIPKLKTSKARARRVAAGHDMPNTPNARKAVRQIAKRTAINKNRVSRMRTFIRKVEEAVAAGDKSEADAALRAAQPEIMRAASKGVLHRNTASRKVSRLSKRVAALAN